MLELVEEERVLGELLAAAFEGAGSAPDQVVAGGGALTGRPVTVVIGTESGISQLNGCSLVLTTYRAGEGRGGTVGVLGPTRMPYSQVAPRVRFVADRVGEAVTRVLS